MKVVYVFVLFLIITVNTGCPKTCIEAIYSFKATSIITPDVDSVKLGDTLFLTSSFPAMLKDQNTGVDVNYSGANSIGSVLAISELVKGDSIAKDAVNNFDYTSLVGRIYNDRNIPSPDRVQQLVYMDGNGTYMLKVGLIAKVKGIYVLGLGDGLSVGRNNSNSCEKASFSFSLANTNQHFYFLYQWNPSLTIDDYYKTKVYYFKVY